MNRKSYLSLIFASFGIFMLIVDSKTSLAGAKEGLEMCLEVLIPSLLPFFFLSILLTGSMKCVSMPFLRPLGRILRIPGGSEPLMLIGLLGGYPVGAQSLSQACESGQLGTEDARRMLAFCNNCGPAFVFGIVAQFFNNMSTVWIIWGIHILSALLVGITVPGNATNYDVKEVRDLSVSQVLRRSLSVMAQVCSWVVLFRVWITFFDRWFGFLLPDTVNTALSGLLELANGCLSLGAVKDGATRFILCSAMLSLGGLCVTMQTFGVVSDRIKKDMYFPGKILQCGYSVLLSSMVCIPLFGRIYIVPMIFSCATVLLFAAFFNIFEKKYSIFRPIRV